MQWNNILCHNLIVIGGSIDTGVLIQLPLSIFHFSAYMNSALDECSCAFFRVQIDQLNQLMTVSAINKSWIFSDLLNMLINLKNQLTNQNKKKKPPKPTNNKIDSIYAWRSIIPFFSIPSIVVFF